jgi:hypothetical protein
MAEEFLDKKVRGLIEPMVSSLLAENPKEPVLFMIEWLQNFSGLKSNGPNMERTELETLRKEMSKYKKRYAAEDEEMEIKSNASEVNHTNSRKTPIKKTKKRLIKLLIIEWTKLLREVKDLQSVLRSMVISIRKKILILPLLKRLLSKESVLYLR